MAKKVYTNPMIFLAGGTDMNTSHEGGSGEDWKVPAGFKAFLEEMEADGLSTIPGFKPSDRSTWPDGFDIDDENTWDLCIDYGE